MLTSNNHILFLEAAAKYFESRPTNGEDSNYWANVYNAENCRKAARLNELEIRVKELEKTNTPAYWEERG